MAKLPAATRFNMEDFKDQKSWIEKLFFPLNRFLTDVTSAFNNNLNFRDNFIGQISALDVSTKTTATAGPTTGGQTFPAYTELQQVYNFKWNFKTSPTDVWVTQISEKTSNPSVRYYGSTLDWYYSNGQIYIQALSGLLPGKTYTVRVIAVTG